MQPPSTATCSALTKVTADVAQTVTLMDKLAKSKGVPDRLEIGALQESVDDAKARIVTVKSGLQTLGCKG